MTLQDKTHINSSFHFRSSIIFCGIFWDLLSSSSSVGHRISVSDVLGTHLSYRICWWGLANHRGNVQLVSTATFLHYDIRHRLLNAGLQIFAVVYRIAGSVSVSAVVCTNPWWGIFVLCFLPCNSNVKVVCGKHECLGWDVIGTRRNIEIFSKLFCYNEEGFVSSHLYPIHIFLRALDVLHLKSLLSSETECGTYGENWNLGGWESFLRFNA